jgi:hypothetical protein
VAKLQLLEKMAGSTGLEPATSGLTVFRRLQRAATESDNSRRNLAVRLTDFARCCTASPHISAQIPHSEQRVTQCLAYQRTSPKNVFRNTDSGSSTAHFTCTSWLSPATSGALRPSCSRNLKAQAKDRPNRNPTGAALSGFHSIVGPVTLPHRIIVGVVKTQIHIVPGPRFVSPHKALPHEQAEDHARALLNLIVERLFAKARSACTGTILPSRKSSNRPGGSRIQRADNSLDHCGTYATVCGVCADASEAA